jgi:hypothetical protein
MANIQTSIHVTNVSVQKGGKRVTMKGKKIRNAKKLYEHLKENRPIWYENFSMLLRGNGHRLDAEDYGQFTFMDVMKSIERGNVFEVKDE